MEPNVPAGGFGAFDALFIVVLLVLVVVPYWKLWQRTGHSGAWGLLMVVPLVNIISLWVLAFKRWPALDGGERAMTDETANLILEYMRKFERTLGRDTA